ETPQLANSALGFSPLFYIINDQQVLRVQTNGQADVLRLPTDWLKDQAGFWFIGDENLQNGTTAPLNVSGKELVVSDSFGFVQVQYFHKRPSRDPLYHFGALSLLDLDWQPANNLAPGSTLAINSWWSNEVS